MIKQGDALAVLKTLPNESVNCCITSPPYWALRDYGTANWEGGDDKCDHIEPQDGQGIASKKQHTNVGSEKIQYKDTCKKCGAKRIDLQLGLEPTFQEYITKLCDIFDEVKRVLQKDGTCWVNLGDTYGGTGTGQEKSMGSKAKQTDGQYELATEARNVKNAGTKGKYDKCLLQIPSRFSIEMCNRGWILRNTIIWHKPNCMPSSVKDRFTVDFEYVFFFVKNKKYWFETQREPHTQVSLNRIKKPWKGKLCEGHALGGLKDGDMSKMCHPDGRNKRTVWKINTQSFKEAHFAVFPEELIETPIKAGCPPQGMILDPFCGSGTTGVVAKKQNKNFVGIELNPKYIEMAERRIKNTERSML